MNKPSLLIAAAAVAFAGIASAETFDSPVHQAGEASTMTMGAPNQLTNNMPQSNWSAPVVENADTTILGASSHNYASSTDYPASNQPMVINGHSHRSYDFQGSASNNSSVPDRAGEVSTISGGAPNLVP